MNLSDGNLLKINKCMETNNFKKDISDLNREDKIKRAIEIIHKLREGLTYGMKYDFGRWESTSFGQNSFSFDILSRLNDPNRDGAEALANLILENYKPKQHPDKTLGYNGWNAPKHPIRNFLIVFYIDFPTPAP